jgi:acyl-coenzyme A synthetase/AMP-(fatty) acid ligase
MAEILEAFDRHCHDRPDAPALWSRGESLRLSFAQLAERAQAWCRRLGAARLPAGAPVAVAIGNRVDFPALFLALLRLGHPMASVDDSIPCGERVELCRRLGIGWIAHRAAAAGAAPTALGKIVLEPLALETAARIAEGTALVKLTSGSTGEPSGCCLTEAALAAGIRQIAEGMAITAGDRLLLAIPLSHSYGFDHGMLSLAYLGASLVLETGYYPARLLRDLEQGEVSFFPAVPPMVKALSESAWPCGLPLRRVISAGGPLVAEFASRFHAVSGHHVHQFYGSTETGGISFETSPADGDAAGTVGSPLPGVTIELDAQGMVTVDSAANFHAYLDQPPRGERRVTLADRAERTPSGRLRLTGRTADLLNVGGRRVSAGAIETSLRKLAGIEDAAVIGIADPVRGDRVVAFVVTGDGSLQLEGQPLPVGLASRDIRPLTALPYTDRGKLDRAQLHRLALEGCQGH